MDSKILLGLLAVMFVVAALAVVFKPAGRSGSYRPRKLMTENEREFFARLVKALPEHYIFPQVALSGLLEASSGNKKQAHSDRLRIAQQRVDYVVCNLNCEVVAVVELDDRTHLAVKDKLRDARLQQGGIRTVRFESKNKPAHAAIRAAVLAPEPVRETTPPPAGWGSKAGGTI